MEVEIKEELLLVLLLKGLAKLLGVINCRMKHLIRLQILSVEVTSCQRASVVPIDDSICVQHRYDINFKVLSQILHELLFLRRRRIEKEIHPTAKLII